MSTGNLHRIRGIKIWRIVYMSVWGILAAGVITAVFFIYQSIYLTALNASVIQELTPNTDWFSLDWKGYEEIKETLNAKKELLQAPLKYKNIFVYSAPANAAASTTPYASSTLQNY